MTENQFRIAKQHQKVRLYLSGGEEVEGVVFLHHSRNEYGLPEELQDVMNLPSPFIAIAETADDNSDAISFYNKSMISRFTYQEKVDSTTKTAANLKEQILVRLCDGLGISGEVQATLPPESARLYDYLNLENELFLKIVGSDGAVSLINKTFIMVVNKA